MAHTVLIVPIQHQLFSMLFGFLLLLSNPSFLAVIERQRIKKTRTFSLGRATPPDSASLRKSLTMRPQSSLQGHYHLEKPNGGGERPREVARTRSLLRGESAQGPREASRSIGNSWHRGEGWGYPRASPATR